MQVLNYIQSFFSWTVFLSMISVFITLLMIYLSVNKIWIRKHEQEVSDSLSIFANTMSIIQASIGLTLAFNLFNIKGVCMGVISFSVAAFYMLIAVGYWVNNDLTLKQKIFRAFKMDRAESSAIIKDMLHVSSIQKIFKIICTLAWADGNLQEAEIKLLKEFAKHNNINYDETMKDVMANTSNQDSVVIMTNLKKDIEIYMNTSPPKNIVIWFQDLVDKLVNADGVVTDQESIIVEEIKGLMNSYLSDKSKKIEKYHLILLPQSKEDEFEILKIKNDLSKSESSIFGSKVAYIIDSFYSEKFAILSREKYVKLFNCAVTVEKF